MAYINLNVDETDIEYAPFNSRNKDRVINADHLARWLSSVNSDGVARKFNELELTVLTGMNVVLNTGVGLVDGHHIYVKSPITIEIAAANGAGNRIDTIGFRLEKESRRVFPYYNTGEVGTSLAPEPLNNDEYIEVPLYNVHVGQGITTLAASNLEDVRQYVVSSATYFKKYDQFHTTDVTTTTLNITVPFNYQTDTVDVYVNGIALSSKQYSVDQTGTIIFNSSIYSGNEIQVDVWHFQDGNGSIDSINVVLDKLEDVEKTTKYFYHCTGVNDNKALSDLAQNFLSGTRDFAGISANAQMEIIVCGDCGVSANYSGDGTQSRPYTYFAFGRAAESTRTIYFNFSNCSQINVACSTTTSTYNTIFSGADINIRNCRLNVTSGYNVDVFNGTNIHCEDSEFWMTTTNDCCVGKCCGYFDKVRTSITSTSGNAYCFYGNGRLLRVMGGDHYAFASTSGKEGVCFYVAASQTENVLFVTMANCPYRNSTQTDTIKVNSGYATIMQNTLWKASTLYSTENCIAYGNVIISKV